MPGRNTASPKSLLRGRTDPGDMDECSRKNVRNRRHDYPLAVNGFPVPGMDDPPLSEGRACNIVGWLDRVKNCFARINSGFWNR